MPHAELVDPQAPSGPVALKPSRAPFNHPRSQEIVPLPALIDVLLERNYIQSSFKFDNSSEFVAACVFVRKAQNISK